MPKTTHYSHYERRCPQLGCRDIIAYGRSKAEVNRNFDLNYDIHLRRVHPDIFSAEIV